MGIFKKILTNDQGATLLLPFVFCMFLVTSFNARAQKGADSVTYYSQTQLDSLLNAKVTPERVSRLLGKSKDGESYLVVIRTKPGDVEIHEQFDDVAIIRSGHGVLKTGPTVTGNKLSGKEPAREWLGGEIQAGRERNVAPGDFIVIPAMQPHQYLPRPGESLTYWTIKVRRLK